MEEKKLTDEVVVAKNAITDEEIVKALENCKNLKCCCFCTLWGEVRKGNHCRDLAIDLIHRLQNDYSKLKEKYVKVLDLNEKVIAEQKAEIERLTEGLKYYRGELQ